MRSSRCPAAWARWKKSARSTPGASWACHAKPCGLLDIAGYYQPLLQMLDNAVAAGFLRAAHREAVLSDEDPAALLDRFAMYRPTFADKWLTRQTT